MTLYQAPILTMTDPQIREKRVQTGQITHNRLAFFNVQKNAGSHA